MRKVFITGTAGLSATIWRGFSWTRASPSRGSTGSQITTTSAQAPPPRAAVAIARLLHDEAMLEDTAALDTAIDAFAPDVIVHLAGQAGVRVLLENPGSYIDSNVTGTFNVWRRRAATTSTPAHGLHSSDLWRPNTEMPLPRTHQADTPLHHLCRHQEGE
jgi:UDP-glucuronate 4-epimerase